MIELERHIEILLLNNDCVIVPDLGGFMAYHADAYYDEEDNTFLPPMRTLGFNPQLKINDSLLAQSYVEAYDISYPDAVQRIEDEVNELRQHLQNEGSFELTNIGTLSVNENGNYLFSPCEAGLLTPSLYAFSSFEITKLDIVGQEKKEEPVAVTVKETKKPDAKVVPIEIGDVDPAPETNETEDDDVIRIKFSWIRNTVAVAAVLIAFFLLALPTGESEMVQRKISHLNTDILFGMMSKDTNISEIDVKKCDIQRAPAKQDSVQKNDSIKVAEPIKTEEPSKTSVVTPPAAEKKVDTVKDSGYCIVLASYVSEQNAEIFVDQLKKKGYAVEIYVNNNIRRVILGHYATSEEAHDDLRRVHKEKSLEDAWVYKFN